MARIVKLTISILEDNHLDVTATSVLSGKEHTMRLPITLEQFIRWEKDNLLIQDAFPNLTPEQREFLMTGSTQEEWDESLRDI